MPFQHIPGGGTIVTGEADTRKVGLLSIQLALTLQVRTGMKHSRNAPVIGARNLLEAAGIKPKRSIKALLQQFYEYRLSIDPEAKAPDLTPLRARTA
jgi:hypothetical protein